MSADPFPAWKNAVSPFCSVYDLSCHICGGAEFCLELRKGEAALWCKCVQCGLTQCITASDLDWHRDKTSSQPFQEA